VLFGLSPRSTSQTSLGVVAELFPTRPTSLDVKVVSSFPLRPSSLGPSSRGHWIFWFVRPLTLELFPTRGLSSRALAVRALAVPSSCRSSSCCSELLSFELLLFRALTSSQGRVKSPTRTTSRSSESPTRTTSRSSEFPTRPTSFARGLDRGRQVFRFARPQGR